MLAPNLSYVKADEEPKEEVPIPVLSMAKILTKIM
jgi:hypothetical protein